VSDTGSDSLPDLDLVPPHNTKKKKVRLKRKERKPRLQPAGRTGETVWLGGAGCSNWAGQGSPACQLGLTLTSLLLLAILGYITSAMHTRLISLEHQLRMKIADDDSRGLKREDKLGELERRLQSVLSNQTECEASLQGVQSSLASLQHSVQQLNKTVSQEQTHSLANLTLTAPSASHYHLLQYVHYCRQYD